MKDLIHSSMSAIAFPIGASVCTFTTPPIDSTDSIVFLVVVGM